MRAFGGAVLFSIPILMTMEMWWLGFYMNELHLALLVLLDIPLLIALSHYAGFEPTFEPLADVLDAFTAYAIGFSAAALLLFLFGVITPGMSADEIIGKIVIQTVPASLGAMLARSQLNDPKKPHEKTHRSNYGPGLFLMGVGAIYLSTSIAPTEEMILIAYQMDPWQFLLLILFSLVIIHGFVYAAIAQSKTPLKAAAVPFWTVFLKFTVVGYGIALLTSAFMLWTFDRTSGLALEHIIGAIVVLSLPASVGAGAARLIL